MRLETLVADHQWPPPQFMVTSLSPPPADNSQAMAQHFAARRALFAQHQQQVGSKIHSSKTFTIAVESDLFLSSFHTIRTIFIVKIVLNLCHGDEESSFRFIYNLRGLELANCKHFYVFCASDLYNVSTSKFCSN
jgi:hypothetical protein